MEKREYKAIYSDIDGTLLNTKHYISAETKEGIHTLVPEDVMFILVSARMPDGMRGFRSEIGRKSPMVCYSGALVLDENDQPVYSQGIEKETALAIFQCIKEKNKAASVSVYAGENWYVESLTDPWARQEMNITGITPKESDLVTTFDGNTHKLLVMGEPSEIEEIEKVVRAEFPAVNAYRSKDTYLEIMSSAVSKSQAIEILDQKYGIEKEQTISFGDSFNDIDMIAYTGLGVAMGNAAEEVKKVADYVTLTNDEDGLVAVFKQVF